MPPFGPRSSSGGSDFEEVTVIVASAGEGPSVLRSSDVSWGVVRSPSASERPSVVGVKWTMNEPFLVAFPGFCPFGKTGRSLDLELLSFSGAL